MKKIFSATLLPTLFSIMLLTSCQKAEIPKYTPICIIQEIDIIKSEDVRNPATSIWQYEYNGEMVYYITSYCCDIESQLFDGECNQICSPDGGLTGTGDGKCPDFFSNRKNEKLVWKDDRE